MAIGCKCLISLQVLQLFLLGPLLLRKRCYRNVWKSTKKLIFYFLSYIILLVINRIPFLYLRLADSDEIIGTDWAEMGERAYGYLPFEGDLNQSQASDTSSEQSHVHKQGGLNKVQKLLMMDKNTVVQGVPQLIEQPVMDYNQKKDVTGGDLLQKSPTTMENASSSIEK